MTSLTRLSSSMTLAAMRTTITSTSASRTRQLRKVNSYAGAEQVTSVDKIRSPITTESRLMAVRMDTNRTLQVCLSCSTTTKNSLAAATVTRTHTTVPDTSPATELTAVRLSICQQISSLSTSAVPSTERRVTRSTQSATVQCNSVPQVRPTVHR